MPEAAVLSNPSCRVAAGSSSCPVAAFMGFSLTLWAIECFTGDDYFGLLIFIVNFSISVTNQARSAIAALSSQ